MSIEEICEKYNIRNYIINDDGSIDVNECVYLDDYGLNKFPLKFNKVYGDFDCRGNNLTTLEGGPKWVAGYFYCHKNKLTSLEHSPEYVGTRFNCSSNMLIDLKYCPNSIGENLFCSRNNITSLEYYPENIGGYINFKDTPIGSVCVGVDVDFARAFNSYKILKDGVVNLKRLKYVMEIFDKPIDLEKIEKYYTIK
tara:strand:- start:1675 stop:2262 length:588 start_codon:yes stop_codon:yes gene_type:complete